MGSAGPTADGAGGWPLATKRSDSSAERRICALGDQSALLGHLSPVEARLAPPARLLLAAPHPTPPSGGRRAHDGRLRGQPSSAGRLCGRRGCRPPVAAGGRRPGPPRPAQTALLGRSATPGRAAAASVVVGWGGVCEGGPTARLVGWTATALRESHEHVHDTVDVGGACGCCACDRAPAPLVEHGPILC